MVAQTHQDTQDNLRQAWRDAVRIVSGRAGDTLGAAFLTRIQKAQDLVLRDCVEPQADGSYIVSGDSGRDYDVTAAFECPCPDASKAPALENGTAACKHALAVMLRKRSIQHMQAQMDAKPEGPAGLPEAPASANVHVDIGGRRVQITLRDVSEDALIARMERVMSRYPVQDEAAQTPEVAASNGHMPRSRPVAEMTDIECDHPGCSAFFWKNYSPDGRQSWLSHRTESDEWHKPRSRR